MKKAKFFLLAIAVTVFLVTVLWMIASMEKPPKIADFQGQIFFTASHINKFHTPKRGESYLYVLKANEAPIQLIPKFTRIRNLVLYPQFQEIGFYSLPIPDDPALYGWFQLDLKSADQHGMPYQTAPALADDFPVKFFSSRWQQLPDGEAIEIPGSKEYDTRVTFSPDRSQVAGIVMTPSRRDSLCIAAQAEGKVLACVTEVEPCEYRSPVWSPDGQWIVYSGRLKEDNFGCNLFELFIVRSDGRELRQLTNIPGPKLDKSTTHAIVKPGESLQNWHKSDDQVWSPDGKLIAFESYDGVYVIHPDGTEQRLVAANAYSPTWSPDGKHLAFIRPKARGILQILLELLPLIRYSPGGTDGMTNILISNIDGTNVMELVVKNGENLSIKQLVWAK